MEKFYSKVQKDLLAHAIYRIDEFRGRQNIIDDSQFLQIATLKLAEMETFQAHIHLWKDLPKSKNIAQESWVVIKGKVEVNFFDIDGTFLHRDVLREGDCSVSLYGGHSYSALTESLVYEFKNGPYLGQTKDKKFIKDLI
jgi:hypothetical protein